MAVAKVGTSRRESHEFARGNWGQESKHGELQISKRAPGAFKRLKYRAKELLHRLMLTFREGLKERVQVCIWRIGNPGQSVVFQNNSQFEMSRIIGSVEDRDNSSPARHLIQSTDLKARLAARQATGQTTPVSDKPKFEAASIRPCEKEVQAPAGARGGGSNSMRITPGRVDALCMTLLTLIRTAYRSLDNNTVLGKTSLPMNVTYGFGAEDGTPVRGGPDWVRSEKYTIAAIGDSTDGPTLQGPMLLELLERRFKMKSRVETEETPVYALTIANGGLKIKPLEPESYEDARALFAAQVRDIDPRDLNALVKLSGSLGCSLRPRNDPAEFNRWREAVRRGAQPPPCGVGDINWSGPNDVIAVGAMPLGVFANMLREEAHSALYDTLNGLFVIDKTGLPETNCLTAIPSAGTPCAPLFSFVMEYARDESFFTRTGLTPERLGLDMSLPKAPSIFAAVEKLGLHLEKIKASREFIVIEHIERPTPN
jgi:uncharacterized protein (TIGR03435 family)